MYAVVLLIVGSGRPQKLPRSGSSSEMKGEEGVALQLGAAVLAALLEVVG